VKNGLARLASQAGQALGDESIHALRNMGFGKEVFPAPLSADKLIELFDLIT
jgi:hypothetical protein